MTTSSETSHRRSGTHRAGGLKRPVTLGLPLAPFFGVMGVAPPAPWGRITSIIPRAHGGNIDNKELTAGATLFLPVFVEGAMFSCAPECKLPTIECLTLVGTEGGGRANLRGSRLRQSNRPLEAACSLLP